MVVEFLTFDVEPEIREAWMEMEERLWSRYLEQRPGFIRKQLWVEMSNPAQVHAMIEWESYELWHSIPDEDIARVDAEMGELFREARVQKFAILRNS
jgi:uncharacterized protein (TIGR03792 family)